MKSEQSKQLFLENLKKVPIIQVACEKASISRATIYRWKNDDEEFAKKLDKALSEGEDLINDMSESQLISLIKDKNFSAIRFWLNHRHNKFKDRIEVTAKVERQDKLSPEQEETVRKALRAVEQSTTKSSKD